MSPAGSLAAGCAIQGPWPARSRAGVTFELGQKTCAQRAARRVFGKELAAWQYAGLAGAPDDAAVEVGTLNGKLCIELSDPSTHGYRGIFLAYHAGEKLVLVNDGFHIHRKSMQRKGLGLRIFSRQVENAGLLGVDRIETTAGRRGGENGYYTWPRFGFDAPLPRKIMANLPLGLEHARTVLDLMEDEKGRLWWKEQGVTIKVVFDLAERSRCRAVFRKYLRGRLHDVADA